MQFNGVIPPVVTPLTDEGELDVTSLERSVERMIEAGVNGLFILGSSGEVAFSTDQRRKEIISNTIKIVRKRVPILVGCIDMQTNRVIEHAKTAEELGADAVVVTAPFYALGGEAEVERHFRLVHRAVNVPIFAYDIPVCVHKKLSNNLLIKLGQEGVLAGVKDSSGDDVSFRFLIQDNERIGSPLTILTGHEVVVDGAYMSGAHGCVPGLGNVDPFSYVRQWNAYQSGDWEKVREEQEHLARLMRIVTVTTGVSGFAGGVGAFKTAMKLMGIFDSNQMPEPVKLLEEKNVEAISEVLKAEGML